MTTKWVGVIMSRKAGVGDRGLGMELRRHREKARLTLEQVGSVLSWSANTMSRLERGMRPDTTPEEVSALLAAIKVTGPERDRIMRMAAGQTEQGWWESTGMSDQARTYLAFEGRATRIVNVEPLLVPGLLQTAAYMHALMIAFAVDKSQIPGRIARRLGRQEVLVRFNPPELVFVVSEATLRRPVGGHAIMAQQIWHLAEEGEKPHVSVRVLPDQLAAHPGLAGAFVVLEFDDEPTVVHIEGRKSGMFPENPDEIEMYRLDAERLMDLALGEAESADLLRAIAGDLERSG